MNKTTATALSIAVLVGLVLSGCGSSSDDADRKATTTTVAAKDTTTSEAAAATPTTAEFCIAAEKAFGDFQPGIDAIFEEHPNPTLEDWAAFLPEPTQEFDAVIAALNEVEPSDEVSDDFEAALAAMQTVSDIFHDAIDAAEAGDQAAYDAAEEANQGGEDDSGEVQGGASDAMGAALDKVIAYCGGPS